VTIAEIGKGILGEGGGVDAIDTYRTSIWFIQCADDLQQGGLSGTAGAYNTYHLSFVDMEVDAF
jgi:hypothetical protein